MAIGSKITDELPFRYRFGTVEFDAQRLELKVSGTLVQVQRKPLEILAQLLANAGSIVTREHLMETVWGGRPIVDNVLASAVTKLRSALGHENVGFLVTHPRVGYRLDAVVERLVAATEHSSSDVLARGMPLPTREDYVLVEQLDSSGANEVWSAQHIRTGEVRVYKLCRTNMALCALKREAALLQLLHEQLEDSGGVARVVDWQLEQQPFFLGFEFGGVNLSTWAEADGQLQRTPIEERIAIFLQIARTLAAVHACGVLHQDLKPSNILLSPLHSGWHVRLTDFGCSRLLQSEKVARLRITQFGLLSADELTSHTSSATPLYVAPELFGGQATSVQSDLYALGVLLYQLLIGDLRLPLAHGWERHIEDELLREDIARATDCDASRRLSTVNELCERLETLSARRTQRASERMAEQAARIAQERAARMRANRNWMLLTAGLLAVIAGEAAVILSKGKGIGWLMLSACELPAGL